MSLPERPAPRAGGPALTAPVDTARRRRSKGRPITTGRRIGAVLVLGGVLAAAPTAIWPTDVITYLAPGSVAPFQQLALWSWGQVADVVPGLLAQGIHFGNPASLVLLVVALLAGLTASACLALRPGSDGVVLGVAGTAWLTATVTANLGQTAGRVSSGLYGDSNRIVPTQTSAGVLQYVAVGLLLAALGVLTGRPVARVAVSGAASARRWARGLVHRPRGPADEGAAASPAAAPRIGIATMRDAAPGSRPGSGAWSGGPGDGWGDDARSGVGFSDDPGADPDHVRPPR
ncbi:hypothetical protein [Terrabacter sp. Root181]|uniref:hypothetical protein n=1 Tax=Terrabacter sp. Root181 TaxID=1736484 RepID=UPI0006F596F3|nr:hypothetical protein [Terrabacter sp. Root181]KRB46236.1 hypothetical protein ASD90_11035 [Terrabacter sp. Root181]